MKLENLKRQIVTLETFKKLPGYDFQNGFFDCKKNHFNADFRFGFFELFKNFKLTFLLDFFSSILYSSFEDVSEKYFYSALALTSGDNVLFFLLSYLLKNTFGYIKSFTQNSVANKSYYFIKSKSLEKFSTLKLEDRIVKKPDLSLLIEEEIEIISTK